LTKCDLWQALDEYPMAKKILIDKGKSLLRKDNLLNEEIVDQIEALEKINATIDDTLIDLYQKLNHIDKRSQKISKLFQDGVSFITKKIERIEDEMFEGK
jgi:cyclic nucleotide gated channel alpha 3